MKVIKITILILILILMSACTAPHYQGKAISFEKIDKVPEIIIVENNATRKGFLKTIKNWLSKNDYKYRVDSNDSKHELEKITIEYVGHWGWDLAIFLYNAKIEAFYKGEKVGEVNYNAPNNFNTDKYGRARIRIDYMLEVLFGKISADEATKSIKSE